MEYTQGYGILLRSGIFILSSAVGATIVVIVNHFKQKHDKRIQIENDIYLLFCKFFFISSIQYSELINKKLEVEDKLSRLNKLSEKSPKEELVYIVQDFDYDDTINIDVSDLSNTLYQLRSMKNFQSGDTQMLQPFYLFNDKYHEIIRHFAKYNEMKRAIRGEKFFTNLLVDYFKEYMPIVLLKIEKQLDFIKGTLDSCDELFNKLGRPRPTKFGNIIKL
ncbi:TPA: hypothetical protein ACT9BX_002268 [Legionella pneumophila]|nr:hypothetical protein [Legionella pneumophila]HAT8742790.1 hypothetical protein [Legionella pneumophila]